MENKEYEDKVGDNKDGHMEVHSIPSTFEKVMGSKQNTMVLDLEGNKGEAEVNQ